jgi:hypothetical protein
MSPTAKTIKLLDCIGEVIYVRVSHHSRFSIFVVLFVPSSRRNFKFLRAKKKEHRKHFLIK